MGYHDEATLGAIHPIQNFSYADEAARTGALGLLAADVGKVAVQVDSNDYYVLVNDVGPVWGLLTGTGGGGSQTPWLQDIDADRFDLSRVADLEQAGGDTAKLYTPTQVSVTPTGTNPRFSVPQANYLYVCDANDNDLRTYDVTDPAAPALVSTLVIGGGRGVDATGRYVLYADEDNGGRLVVVDVENKSAPVIAGSVVTGGSPRGVKGRGTVAVVTYNSNIDGVRTFDVSDPTAPVQLDTHNMAGAGRTDLDIRGTIVAVPTASAVQLFDIADPSNIVLLSTFSSEVDSCKFQGRYLYTANETTDEFEVWDTVDPSLPVLVGQLALVAPASVRAIAPSGNFVAFVDASNDEMRVVDVSDPTNPRFISTGVSVGLNPIAIATTGRLAYVLDNNGDQFFIFDLSGIDAQNLTVGNIDAGNINLRKDLKMGGVLSSVGGSFGVGGVFSDGEIGGAGALRGSDLLLRGFIELGLDIGVTPPTGTPSIYHTVLGTNFDVPASDGYLLQINGGLEYDFGAVRADFQGNRLFGLGRVELSDDVAPALTEKALWAEAAGMRFNVPTGDNYEFDINGALVLAISAAAITLGINLLDMSGGDVIQMAHLSFDDLLTNIHQNNFDLVMQMAAGGSIDVEIGGANEYDFDAARADFLGNDLVNVAEISSAGTNLPVLGFLRMDGGEFLAWRNEANDDDNLLGYFNDELQIAHDAVIRYAFTDAHLNMTGRNLFDAGVLLLGTSTAPAATAVALWHDGADLNANVPTGGSHIFEINGIDTFILSLGQFDLTGRNLVGVGNINGQPHASLGNNVVEIFVEADFPGNATEIQLAVGTDYILMAPISTARTIKHPATGGAFTPSTIRGSQKETTTLTYLNTATEAMFSTQSGQGQLVLKDLIITNDSLSQAVFDLLGNAQTELLTELDNTVVFDALGDGSVLELCIFNVNNESFLNLNRPMTLIDCEVNFTDAFAANFSDSFQPGFDFRQRSLSSTARTLVTIRNTKLSSQPNESYFRIHKEFPAGSFFLIDGVTASPFTPGTGAFFGGDNDDIVQLSNSIVNPGTHTRCHDTLHTVLDGDEVTLSAFVTQTQYNGVTYVAVNVVEGVTFDVAEVFVADDATGSWAYSSIDGTDPIVRITNSPPHPDSGSIGSVHVKGNSTVTTIVTQGVFTDVDLGTALAGSNIERWILTDAATGELTYIGIEPFSGVAAIQFSIMAAAGSPAYSLRAVKNGAVLADDIEAQVEAPDALTVVGVGLLLPVECVTGDAIRVQVANEDGTDDVTIVGMTMAIQ